MSTELEPTVTNLSTASVEAKPGFFKKLAWSSLFIFFLLLFTLFKLPQEKIKDTIQGNISALLAPRGITFAAKDGNLSMGFGISYVFHDVTLSFPGDEPPVNFDEISLSPAFMPIVTGKLGLDLGIKQGPGSLQVHLLKGLKSEAINVTLKQLDFGKLGVVSLLSPIPIQANGVFTGTIDLSGDLNNLATLSGITDLTLSRLNTPEQNLFGFNLPKIAVSEGKMIIDVGSGKAKIRTLTLGKSPSDDIQGNVTGDITLGANLDRSNLNLKILFSLSDNIKKSLALIDALLASGRQPDGSYALSFTGNMAFPQMGFGK